VRILLFVVLQEAPFGRMESLHLVYQCSRFTRYHVMEMNDLVASNTSTRSSASGIERTDHKQIQQVKIDDSAGERGTYSRD